MAAAWTRDSMQLQALATERVHHSRDPVLREWGTILYLVRDNSTLYTLIKVSLTEMITDSIDVQ